MTAPAGLGLRDLSKVALDGAAERAWRRVIDAVDGDRVWRERKCAEVRDLLALALLAPRLQVEFLDPRGELRALVRLRAPVPYRGSDGALAIGGAALVAIVYPRAALWQALPGGAFASLLHPAGVFLPNVQPGAAQRLCLGPRLPAGTRIVEIVMLVYRVLALQEVVLDERDPAGVLNLEATRYWQEHADRIPLSTAPFLAGAPKEGEQR